jgi:xylulokinase
MELVLGLDVGTTATKALAFDRQGKVVASASHPNPLITPAPGWVEQDPEALWQGVVATTRAVTAQLSRGDRIVALAQSSQAGTTIPVDSTGRPVHNAISWMDGRADAECEQIKRTYGAEAIYRTTGWVLWAGLPLQHIAWLRAHCPDEFACTRYFLFVNDFVGLRLSGERCMDPANAGITQLFNLGTGDWDETLPALAGIRRAQLSPIRPAGCVIGKLTDQAASATGLSKETLVVNGSHDQYCSALGLGITRPGRTMLSCGTAWVILAVPPTREAGLRGGMRVSRHPISGRWGAVLSLGGVGASFEWLIDTVWGPRGGPAGRAEAYAAVNAAAARSPAGAAGLLCLPLAGGHPERGEGTSGGFVGLSLSHSRDDMARAVMEGICYELRWTLDEIRAAGVEVEQLTMVGGAARSPVWPQIVADVSGLPVMIPAVTEAASWGAARLAGVAAGLYPGMEEAAGPMDTERTADVDTQRHAAYEDMYQRYKSVSEAVLSGGGASAQGRNTERTEEA